MFLEDQAREPSSNVKDDLSVERVGPRKPRSEAESAGASNESKQAAADLV